MRPQDLVRGFEKNGSVPPFLILNGAEEYLRAEARAIALRYMGSEADLQEIDWEAIKEDEGALQTCFDEARTGSLFGSGRLVVFKNAGKLFGEHGDSLVRFVAEGPPAANLLFEGDELLPRKSGAKTPPALQAMIEAGGVLVDCSPMGGKGARGGDAELLRWITARMREKGKTIDADAAQALAEREGRGLRALAGEIEKLVLKVGDAERVAVDDVIQAVGDSAEATLFEIVDAFAERRSSAALDAVARVRRQGIEGASGQKSFSADDLVMRLLALLASRLREIGRIVEETRSGLAYDEAVATVMGPHRRWLAPKIRPMIEARSNRELGEAVLGLYELERDLKTGRGDAENLLMSFLVTHGGRGPAGSVASRPARRGP